MFDDRWQHQQSETEFSFVLGPDPNIFQILARENIEYRILQMWHSLKIYFYLKYKFNLS